MLVPRSPRSAVALVSALVFTTAALGCGSTSSGTAADVAGAPAETTTPAPAPATTPADPATTSPSTLPVATTPAADEAAAAGAYFPPGSPGLHLCSAVVLHSTTRDLIATAAHCVIGNARGAQFAPGYVAGTSPLGRWKVRAAWVDPAWRLHRRSTADLAILRVGTIAQGDRTLKIEDVVPGVRLGHAPAAGTTVRPRGYPFGVRGSAVHCTSAARIVRDQWPAFDCGGFADGTSGGPWFAGSGSALRVVGLVSGLHQGGCSPSTSYSVALGGWSDRLLARAERVSSSDIVPLPPSDGCG